MKKKVIQELEEEYNLIVRLFGINSRCWDMIHQHCSKYAFCEENRRSLIAEYLILENFVNRAKQVGFMYYYGIDEFIREYKNAVYNCLNISK